LKPRPEHVAISGALVENRDNCEKCLHKTCVTNVLSFLRNESRGESLFQCLAGEPHGWRSHPRYLVAPRFARAGTHIYSSKDTVYEIQYLRVMIDVQ
jgi:hypothetical protein